MDPVSLVIFGATGDLSRKKLFKALLGIYVEKELPKGSEIIGFARRAFTDKSYHELLRLENEDKSFLSILHYHQGHFDESDAYIRLKERLNSKRRIFCISTSPEDYSVILKELKKSGVVESGSLILLEKPFGTTKEKALDLKKLIQDLGFSEQIRLIDHYLGKEILSLIKKVKEENSKIKAFLEPENITKVTVRVLEEIDIEGRGMTYDVMGALKDVGQNHLLQMLASVVSLPKDELFKSLKPQEEKKEEFLRCQYEGYLEEENVNKDSETETYFKIKEEIQAEGWDNVKVVIEAGKALSESIADISVEGKGGGILHVEIQPNPHISLDRESILQLVKPRDAYEYIFKASIEDNVSFFVSIEEAISSWDFVEGVENVFKKMPLCRYSKGERNIQYGN